MKKFFGRYGICLSIVAVIACVLSVYIYNNLSKEEADAGKPGAYEDKTGKFNSLVPGVFILNGGNEDYESIGDIFSSVGYGVFEGSFEEYEKLGADNYFLLVPEKEAERLEADAVEYISEKIKEGRNIMTWGESPLSESLGIAFSKSSIDVNGYMWKDKSDIPITFEKPSGLKLFSYKNGFRVLAEDIDKNPVMISGNCGKGNLIFSGIPIVSERGSGYEHFPFILEAVMEQFNIAPIFERDDLAFYVDIDYHRKENPAELAERIRSYGANQVNISAWYSVEEYGDFYKELIEECHKKGISAFAWFELPFVSVDFWDLHPEWREKTASGEDAHIDWRRLMALSDPEALQEIKRYMAGFIGSYDWDGVDIAEIYFESPGGGFEDKAKFTPMNDSFRKSFQESYGVDPKEIHDPFSRYYWKFNKKMKQNIIDYRVELITKLHEEFLLLCEELKKEKPYLQIVVTVIDSIADKDMREKIGVDARKIAKLQDKYHFMLQIEDPYTLWKLGPDRYKVIGEEYRNIMSGGNKLSIDINVIDRGGEVYPTKKQRGVELYQLINNAGQYTDRVILYSLSTFERTDMKLVPYTTSNDVDVREVSKHEYILKAGRRFIWNTDTEGKTFYVDGEKWPFVSAKGIIVPGGEHSLKVQDIENANELFIKSISGEISDISQDDKINFSYSSEGRFFAVVNIKPSQVEIDGIISNPEIKEGSNEYTIILPEGRHNVSIY